jgi:trehalose 6-phosphate phosphatase
MARLLLENLEEVRSRIRAAGRVLLCLDYDGTLTPLVDRPEQASLSPAVRKALTKLHRPPRVHVAVVSGRCLADVKERVGLADLIYAGNHGLEIHGPSLRFVEPTAAARRAALHRLSQKLQRQLAQVPGLLVEPKGLTTSVHYRQVAPERVPDAERLLQAAVENLQHDFVITTGAMVWEVRPNVAWHKGSAVVWLREQPGFLDALTVFAGDDRTDEDAFASLPDQLTVKVGATPATNARYWLHDWTQVRYFLEWLASELGQPPTASAKGVVCA